MLARSEPIVQAAAMSAAAAAPGAPDAPADSDRSFLGHPRGLAYLAFTEAWERFSYYGMQTLLVLYMVNQLLLPGHVGNIAGFAALRAVLERAYGGPLSVVALASAIFGLYTSLVYLTPIAGGIIADRWLGRTRTVTLGALLMAAGHFLMAFEAWFLVALTCLLSGVGCFKGNLASQVGELYPAGDPRRADAFQIYYLAINAGVIATPLVVGTLGELVGWHYGFGAAGIGMLIGLVIYLAGRRWLPAVAAPARGTRAVRPPLTRDERIALTLLVALLPVLAVGMVGNQEIFNAYMLWAPATVDLVFFGRTMPTTWLITVDSVLSVSALVAVLGFWRWWGRRFVEPSEVTKIVLGLFVSAIGVLMLAAAAQIAAAGHKASLFWALAFHVLNSIGGANLLPVGLALYTRAAPKSLAGTVLGLYFLHLFAANNLVGWLGGLLEKLPGAQFWLLHAALVGGAGVVFLAARQLFGHLLAPRGEGG
jgi:POT family proton-dependent oligopeptide transporter